VHGVPGGQGNGYRTGDTAMDGRRSDPCHSTEHEPGSQHGPRADSAGEEDRVEGGRGSDRRTTSVHSERGRTAGGLPVQRGRAKSSTAPGADTDVVKGRAVIDEDSRTTRPRRHCVVVCRPISVRTEVVRVWKIVGDGPPTGKAPRAKRPKSTSVDWDCSRNWEVAVLACCGRSS
jgi:hypothetical protein